MKLHALLLVGLLAAAPLAAHAQTDPAQSARAAIQDLNAAADALNAAKGARNRVAALTQTVMAYEAGLAAMREGLRRATIREASIRGVFEAQSDRLSQLLGVLQSIQSAPAPQLLLHPSGPIGTARSAMILSDVAPALQHEAQALREALQEVAVLRALQESAVGALEDGLSGAQEARTQLSLAVSDRTDLPRRFSADKAAMQTLVDSAKTLDTFASGLMRLPVQNPQAGGEVLDFDAARGHLDMPVLGAILRHFDEADAAGIRRPGLIIATRPLSLVTAPWPATIRYLGPLLDYGNVVILEPGEGTLLVLAGLGQIYGSVGEVVPKGAPVGLMGGAEADSQAFLISSTKGGGTDRSETLYIELRKNGTPVDPEDWFLGSKD